MLKIDFDTTMGEILDRYPSARVGLFQRYHIGGCLACGYDLSDTLGAVRKAQNIEDSLPGIVECIESSVSVEAKLHISAADVLDAHGKGQKLHFFDVRLPSEFEAGHLPGAQVLNVELTFEALDSWPKGTAIITYSDYGRRSLDKASYFCAYGLKNVRSMDGGLEAWRRLGGPVEMAGEGGPSLEPLPLVKS